MAARLQSRCLTRLRSLLLRRHQSRFMVRFLRGTSTCDWRGDSPEAQDGGCGQREGLTLAVIVLVFCISLVFLYFWGQAKNDYDNFDWFSFGGLGVWFPWSVVLLVITATFFSYITILLLVLFCLLSERQTFHLHWVHKVLVLMVLLVSLVGLSILSDLWSQEWTTLLLSFQITAPFLHLGGVLLMTTLSWPIAVVLSQIISTRRRLLLVALYFIPLLGLYLAPLGLFSPCIKEKINLGPRPALIGHRGAPMEAPENTLMSFQKAVESGCSGLETDVRLSLDGVPFLMHDSSLLRTTNVAVEFPERRHTQAAMFTWAELKRLNAGAWFAITDPFRTVWTLSDSDRVWVQSQSVWPLVDFLEFAARDLLLVIFDLHRPPRGHPYRDNWVHRTLNVLNQSSISSSQVLWLPSDLRSLVREIDPDLQQTSGSQLPLEDIRSNDIVQLNLHYSHLSDELVSMYSLMNVSVNLYVVNEPWLYSVAWCSGVQSVTTNAPHLLSHMTRPLLLMSPGEYRVMWTITDLMSVVLVLSVFCFHWWRERALTFSSGTGTLLQFRERPPVWSIGTSHRPPPEHGPPPPEHGPSPPEYGSLRPPEHGPSPPEY